MKPVSLAPNLVEHFYRGGERIAALRGIATTSEFQPEEWLASTVARAGESPAGLSRTADGTLLRDLVSADHTAWVGPDAAAAWGRADVGILVKLLDARQRLPVHVHPSREFATSHLGCPYGKTEAWFVLESASGAAVYLGWNTDVDRGELDDRRDAQDSEWMLSHMNRIEVAPGMGIVVPAGTAHAIDAGILLAEVQEPTDMSILLEWSGTTLTRNESHLGLGFDAVMPAVSKARLPLGTVERLVTRNDLSRTTREPLPLLAADTAPFFRLFHAAPEPGGVNRFAAGFAVVLVLSGSAELCGSTETVTVNAGDVLAVPHSFGDWRVSGDAGLLVGTPGDGWPATLNEATGETANRVVN
ncbi:class I mannose-6-phosphate isomerase [Okibacterium endophyticum]